jgi:hypothetical protein
MNQIKLSQEDIDHLNRAITSNEIEAAIVSQKRKDKGLTDSLLNSTRPLKKNFFHRKFRMGRNTAKIIL